jgi:tRNA(His) 5'-end guanylyltransferase
VSLHNCRELKSLGEYDRLMRRFEVVADTATLPDVCLVIRADAHRHLEWKKDNGAAYPFGERFVTSLRQTAQQVLSEFDTFRCSFIHGDEISFLVEPKMSGAERKRTRLASLVASACAASFVQYHGNVAIFHCVLSELPTLDHVVSYFMWQKLVAERNYLSWLFATEIESNVQVEDISELKREFNTLALDQRIEFLQKYLVHICERKEYNRAGEVIVRNDDGQLEAFTPSGDDEQYLNQLLKLLSIEIPKNLRKNTKHITRPPRNQNDTSRFQLKGSRSRLLPGNKHK